MYGNKNSGNAGKAGKMKWTTKLLIFLSAVAMIAMTVTLCIFGARINKLDKTDELSARNGWEKGLLAADGGEVRGTISIRSKNFVPINGLKVDLRDNAGITYRIFFYDENQVFISATEELVVDYDVSQLPELAEYARFMITPMNDPEVSRSEISEYASELTVEWTK
ncbi:MAG: hypothetical protein IJ514_08075 [Clostridia bacterium]|nr:hypothetical protein [Clostridia bacterium]